MSSFEERVSALEVEVQELKKLIPQPGEAFERQLQSITAQFEELATRGTSST